MSRNDIRIVDSGGRTANPVRTFYLKQGEATLTAGEPVKISPTAAASGASHAGSFYPILLGDGDVLVGATNSGLYFLGIVAKDSTQTGTADGTVDVYLDLPGTIYAAKPKTAGATDTSAEISRRQFYSMVIDLTSSKFTIDDTVAHLSVNPFVVVGGSADNDELHFICKDIASWRKFI